MYCTIEKKKNKNQVYLSHSYTILVHPEAFSSVSSCEPRRQPAQACKWFIFKVCISGAFNKMRGNGFITFFMCPCLIDFHRLGGSQDVAAWWYRCGICYHLLPAVFIT